MIDVDSQSDGLGCFLWVRQVPNSGSAEPFIDFFDAARTSCPRADSAGMSIGSCNTIQDSSGSCMHLNMFLSACLIRR